MHSQWLFSENGQGQVANSLSPSGSGGETTQILWVCPTCPSLSFKIPCVSCVLYRSLVELHTPYPVLKSHLTRCHNGPKGGLLAFNSQLPSMPIIVRIWELPEPFHTTRVQRETYVCCLCISLCLNTQYPVLLYFPELQTGSRTKSSSGVSSFL